MLILFPLVVEAENPAEGGVGGKGGGAVANLAAWMAV